MSSNPRGLTPGLLESAFSRDAGSPGSSNFHAEREPGALHEEGQLQLLSGKNSQKGAEAEVPEQLPQLQRAL